MITVPSEDSGSVSEPSQVAMTRIPDSDATLLSCILRRQSSDKNGSDLPSELLNCHGGGKVMHDWQCSASAMAVQHRGRHMALDSKRKEEFGMVVSYSDHVQAKNIGDDRRGTRTLTTSSTLDLLDEGAMALLLQAKWSIFAYLG